ncbi:MAG: DUF4340 domain-containing protein [Planctomycetes bacterium]|nr:DUF4340 domain-containing protein [Planctomycetota bacterium]
MNSKTIGILGAALVALAGVTVLTLNHREQSVQSAETRTKLFPSLKASLKDAAKIGVQRKDGSFTLERTGTTWGLAEKGGFPVEGEPVRKALLALAEMETVEAKTQNPTLYAQLGVEDVESEGAKSALVTVQDGAGKELARLLVGKNYESKNYGAPGQSYVRKPGDAQSWLVKGQLELKEKGADWLAKKILEVKRERMRTVSIVHPDGHKVAVQRERPDQTDYTLLDLPEGKELKYATIASTLASGLEYVNLEDVQAAGTVDFTKDAGPVATFTCFDGLEVTVRCKEQDGKTYAQYSAAYVEPPAPAGPEPEAPKEGAPAKKSPDEVKKEVDALNATLQVDVRNLLLQPQRVLEAAGGPRPGQEAADAAGRSRRSELGRHLQDSERPAPGDPGADQAAPGIARQQDRGRPGAAEARRRQHCAGRRHSADPDAAAPLSGPTIDPERHPRAPLAGGRVSGVSARASRCAVTRTDSRARRSAVGGREPS